MKNQKQIVSVHVGQAGLQVGHSIWELYCNEHGILPNGLKATSLDNKDGEMDDKSYESFFLLSQSDHYVPRALFIDLEPTIICKLLLLINNPNLSLTIDIMYFTQISKMILKIPLFIII